MYKEYQNAEELRQNLKEIGCSDEVIFRLLACLMNGNKAEGICCLEKWREELLNEIHNERHCVENIDRMLYVLRERSE